MSIFNIKKIFNRTDAQDLSSNLSTTPTNPQQGLIDLESIKANDIVVLGSGCAKCNTLENHVKEALQLLGKDNKIVHITDFAQIAACGVMTTPALMINNTIISTGKVLTVAELQDLLPQYLSN